MNWTLDLPYEKPPLSLNDRGQTPGARRAKSAKAAMIRADVATLARAAGIPAQEAIHVRLHYRPATAHRRDADNLVATLKPAIDGLRDAQVIPDDDPSHLDWSAPRIHPPILPDRKPALWLVITSMPEGMASVCELCGKPVTKADAKGDSEANHAWGTSDGSACVYGYMHQVAS